MKLILDRLDRLNNLQKRIIAGIIGGALMVSAVCINEWTYFSLFFLICLFSLLEFYNLLSSTGIRPNKIFGIISGLLIFTLIFLAEGQIISPLYYFLLFPFLSLLFLTELFRRKEKPFINIAFTFLGNIYVALPIGLLNVSAYYGGTYNYAIILGILLMLWANDIGGYIAGMALGKNKLFYRISPKKTWEGSIGGALTCVFTALILSVFYKDLTISGWLFLSLIITVMGSYGDLVESFFKRSLEIKDSGRTIPGHGGFLDRFDGLFLSSSFIAAFLKIIS